MKATRIKELTYDKVGTDWRVFHEGSCVGPIYHSKTELLCDFDRYSKEWGY